MCFTNTLGTTYQYRYGQRITNFSLSIINSLDKTYLPLITIFEKLIIIYLAYPWSFHFFFYRNMDVFSKITSCKEGISKTTAFYAAYKAYITFVMNIQIQLLHAGFKRMPYNRQCVVSIMIIRINISMRSLETLKTLTPITCSVQCLS